MLYIQRCHHHYYRLARSLLYKARPSMNPLTSFDAAALMTRAVTLNLQLPSGAPEAGSTVT